MELCPRAAGMNRYNIHNSLSLDPFLPKTKSAPLLRKQSLQTTLRVNSLHFSQYNLSYEVDLATKTHQRCIFQDSS